MLLRPQFSLYGSFVLTCILLLSMVPGLASCKSRTQESSPTAGGLAQADDPEQIDGPGVDFSRRSIGLPTQTLDYTGTSASALAGAKASGDIFFGQSVSGNVKLFHRSLREGKRRFVSEIKLFHDGSLASSADGSRLVYCRFRPLKDLIKDVQIPYPDPVAVTYALDVRTKAERMVFDFAAAEFSPWRANGVQPFMSADGSTIAQLAYDADRLILSHHSQEWLRRWMRQKEQPEGYSAEQRQEDGKYMSGLLELPEFRAAILKSGLAEDEINVSSERCHKAILDLNLEMSDPRISLLLSKGDKARALNFELLPGFEDFFHFIAGLGNNVAVLVAEDATAREYRAQPLMVMDLETGRLRKLAEVSGAMKLFALSPDEKFFTVVYSPIDPETKVLATDTHILRIELASGETQDRQISGDYLGILDLSSDGRYLAGQDSVSYGIYLINCETGERELVSEQLQPITGLFLDARGEALVMMSAGITYWVDLSPKGRTAARITESEFQAYAGIVREFLQKLGFVYDTDKVKLRYEERKGLAAHEVAVEVGIPNEMDKAMLMRIDVASKKVISLWLPTGYLLPAGEHLKRSNLDYYDVEALAKDLLDRCGWIPVDKRVLYQPGPNPLYDQRSDSYVVTFREKYQLASASETAYANEATIRITAGSGQLAEMTLSLNHQVQRQPIVVERDRLDFLVRNLAGTAMPSGAPVRVDTQGARLISYTVRSQELKKGMLTGSAVPRLCWEVDTLLEPEDDLVFTNLIDTETGEQLGSLSYMPVAPTATTTGR
jgi:hypothetical protein